MELQGLGAKSVSWQAIFGLGMTGAHGVLAAVLGPDQFALSLLSMAIQKLALVKTMVYRAKVSYGLFV